MAYEIAASAGLGTLAEALCRVKGNCVYHIPGFDETKSKFNFTNLSIRPKIECS